MLAILLTGLTVTANAATTGWKKEGNVWTYVKADGTLATDEWIKDGGKWYYFIGTAMAENQVFFDGSKWYAADKSGAMIANGWFGADWKWEGTKGTTWYYAGADGALVRGWKQIGKIWYYFGYEEEPEYAPAMAADCTRYINKKSYAFKHSGEMIVGWGQPWIANPWNEEPDTDWVYANADGSLVKNTWKKIDGKWYYFWGSVMVRDTVLPFVNGEPDWSSDSPTVYGFNKSGAMVENGWYKEVYFWYDEEGAEHTGYDWYYFGKDGAAKKGWLKDGGKWYYLDADWGYMRTEWLEMRDGTVYYMDPTSGAMVTGWKQIDETWFYFKDSGAMAKKEWVKSGSKWYYLKDYGEMAKSETLTIDGKEYTFDANGAWIEK